MRNKKNLIINQLDQKLKFFTPAAKVSIPSKGWIQAIRTGLNMTLEQLGNKLSMTKQGVKKIEENEAKGSISLNTLREVAKAFDMQLVYGFVPNKGSLKNMIDDKAKDLATKIVLRTHQNMHLENQAITNEQLQQAIDELAEELKRELNRSLWD